MPSNLLQRQSLSPAAQALFLGMLAFLLAMPWFFDGKPLMRGVVLGIALLTILIWLNFRTLTVKIERGTLKVGFPIFNSTIALQDIESIRQEWISAFKSGGVGLRLRPQDGIHWAYVARSSNGLRLKVRGRSTDVAFTCDHPEQVLAAMQLEIPNVPVEVIPQ